MSTPTLDYANPAVFFDDVYPHRSSGTLWFAAAFTVFGLTIGGLAVAEAVDHPVDRMSVSNPLPLFGVAAVLLLGAGYCAALYLAGGEDRVRITEHGISDGRAFRPWGDIEWLGGYYADEDEEHVCVTYAVRPGVDDGPLGSPLPAKGVTILTADQFDDLFASVQAYLARAHPHVKVDRRPRTPQLRGSPG